MDHLPISDTTSKKLNRQPSAFSLWGLSFGCVIGWGCIVMPGTSFLPNAGPLGSTSVIWQPP